MNYSIIATLGPSSNTETIWQELLAAGASGFRLNTSHLTLPQLQEWLDRLSRFMATLDPQPVLILDLQGSKWRLGQFPPFELGDGQEVRLVCETETDRPNLLPVPHPDFFQAATLSGKEIVLNDARIRLELTSPETNPMTARVIRGGPILSRKGITYTSSDYRHESLSQKDQAILAQTRNRLRTQGGPFHNIRYALSYVKDADEMFQYRTYCGSGIYLIAKIERRPALDQAEEISLLADELWLCRGDLGAELGLKDMAAELYRFSDEVGTLPSPVYLAGQVLEHMTGQPTPTRSELCYLHDALRQGYRGVVLSDETAIGRYPVESCRIAALFRDVDVI